jgi:small ubiquitin-related modifier|eukprot:g4009.t1
MADTKNPKLPVDTNNQNNITLRVKCNSDDSETFFKVKMTTKMGKVFNAYCARKRSQRSAFRFLLDGERIDDDDTPKSLELEDQDQIDCFMEMIGGGNPSYGDRW